MSETAETLVDAGQHSIELPDGVVLSGAGEHSEELTDLIEQRNHELKGTKPEEKAEAKSSDDKPTRGQKRFSQLTSERDKAVNETVAERTKREAAEKRIAELEAQLNTPKAETKPEEQKTTELKAERPSPNDIGTKYADYDAYLEALADFIAEDKISAKVKDIDARLNERIEADRASRTHAEQVTSIATKGRAAYADFDAVVGKADMEIGPQKMADILRQKNAHDVVYALAKDPAKLQAVQAAQSPLELGMILATIPPSTGAASPASSPTTVLTSNAPAPYQPVGDGSRTQTASAEELAMKGTTDFDSSGYRERRAAERKRH